MLFFFFFWLHLEACGILVPQAGIATLAVKELSPNHLDHQEIA